MDAALQSGGRHGAARTRPCAASSTRWRSRSRRRSKNLVCTDQYGGPQQAVIAGTHRGSRVWTTLGMRNGCDISRAKRLAFLVPGFSANPNS